MAARKKKKGGRGAVNRRKAGRKVARRRTARRKAPPRKPRGGVTKRSSVPKLPQ